jgi:hypothetical protein
MEKKEPTKFILALRRYREHKRQWIEEMDAKLAAEEEALRQARKYLFYDAETA